MKQLDNLNVLVLDDHKNMRLLWRNILLAFGIRNVIESDNAEDAFLVVQNQPVDLVIVDYHLEGLTGAEFIAMLRRAPDSPAPYLPAIACTADTRRTILRLLVDSGVDEVLAKPVSAEQAWKKLSTVIMKRRPFIRAPGYVGPDRRRRVNAHYNGPDRRLNEPVERKVV